jgi:MerR family transcriptional regulator, redox-sensitive transcriptional activator SoxR
MRAYKLKCCLSQAHRKAAGIEEKFMLGLKIGEVARRAGVAASTLRYYEKAGLLPAPARISKRRHYDRQVLGRIRIILIARDAGFTVSETRTFFDGFPFGTTPAARWRAMARKKLGELEVLASRVNEMKALLEASFHCECRRLEDCERLIARQKSCGARPGARESASKHRLTRLGGKR